MVACGGGKISLLSARRRALRGRCGSLQFTTINPASAIFQTYLKVEPAHASAKELPPVKRGEFGSIATHAVPSR